LSSDSQGRWHQPAPGPHAGQWLAGVGDEVVLDTDFVGAAKAAEGNWDPTEPALRSAHQAADRQLYDRLAARGFAGPEYAMFAGELAAYGIGICSAWLVTGLMFAHCARRGRPLPPPPGRWSSEDRSELVLETVAVALKHFREYALVRSGWTADGGASLKTYFIGSCVLSFPNVYRRWRREDERWSRVELDDETVAGLPCTVPDPADVAVANVELRNGLRELDPRTAAALALTAEGYSHEEIAEVLGISIRAVEGLLYRHRWRQAEPGERRRQA